MRAKQRQSKDMIRHMVAAAGILLLTCMAVDPKFMSVGETNLFRSINNWPNALAWPFLVITQAGSQWMLFGLTLVLLAYRLYRPALRIFSGGVVAFLLAQLLKHLIMRPRPFTLLSGVHVREPLLADYGFPSAHTAVATAVSLLIMPIVPKKWRWLCWLWILLVAISRVYLGVHAPLDVIGGFAIGLLVFCGTKLVHGKLGYVRKITGLKLSR